MKVYLSSIEELKDAASYDAAFLRITEDRKSALVKYYAIEDRKRSIIAGLLLNYALYEYHFQAQFQTINSNKEEIEQLSFDTLLTTELQLCQINKKENGKPFCFNEPGFFYNISHSGECVICAVSDEEVGADIQVIKKNCSNSLAKKMMSEKEYLKFRTMDLEQQKKFLYYIWTVKESACKYTGMGLKQEFRNMEVDINAKQIYLLKEQKTIFYKMLEVKNDYLLSVCYHSDPQ